MISERAPAGHHTQIDVQCHFDGPPPPAIPADIMHAAVLPHPAQDGCRCCLTREFGMYGKCRFQASSAFSADFREHTTGTGRHPRTAVWTEPRQWRTAPAERQRSVCSAVRPTIIQCGPRLPVSPLCIHRRDSRTERRQTESGLTANLQVQSRQIFCSVGTQDNFQALISGRSHLNSKIARSRRRQ